MLDYDLPPGEELPVIKAVNSEDGKDQYVINVLKNGKYSLNWQHPGVVAELTDKEKDNLLASLAKGAEEGNVFTRYYSEAQIKFIQEHVDCAMEVLHLHDENPSYIWCVIASDEDSLKEEIKRI